MEKNFLDFDLMAYYNVDKHFYTKIEYIEVYLK